MKNEKSELWEWVKAISVLSLVAVITFKIWVTPLNITVDFPTLLSLLLALFSVGLAALFYFKATETSNTFYDNTHNFTRDIAQLLVKMESGFGEKLRHLDEGYSSMRDYIQNMPSNSEDKAARKKIEQEKEEVKKVVEERNEMISSLMERAQLHGQEREEFLSELSGKEAELEDAQKEISKLKRRQVVERMKRSRNHGSHGGFDEFVKNRVISAIGIEVFNKPGRYIVKAFHRVKDDLPGAFLFDMSERDYINSDEELTPEGVVYLRELAEDME